MGGGQEEDIFNGTLQFFSIFAWKAQVAFTESYSRPFADGQRQMSFPKMEKNDSRTRGSCSPLPVLSLQFIFGFHSLALVDFIIDYNLQWKREFLNYFLIPSLV